MADGRYRDMVLVEHILSDTPVRVLLNDQLWDSPINVMPKLGSTE